MKSGEVQQQFNLVSKEYDENRRKFIPCFDDYYELTTDFVAKSLEKTPSKIIDLGAGTGLLTSFYFKHFSESEYLLADIAEEMLKVAKKRIENLQNVKYIVCDYSKDFPLKDGERAELIISALSIHHLENEEKNSLFQKVFQHIEEGGVFVNYDQFCVKDKGVNAKIEKYWIDQIQASGISDTEYQRWLERKKLDRECTVQDEIKWLKEAGFSAVECIYFSGKFGVILAKK
ncbi:MAG: class I SAM-dependent methyltransferase [Treponema sp.]|nr:class I SAM-dependent methyltransferase [Treponema sp.]